jgi:hypothetical protein
MERVPIHGFGHCEDEPPSLLDRGKLCQCVWRRGRDSNPRYRFKPVRRFSKPLLSTTQPPLRDSAALHFDTTTLPWLEDP